MTSKLVPGSTVPFLLRFAEPIADPPPTAFKYIPERQIAQVYVNGQWIDTPDAVGETGHITRKTAVHQETTDDQ